MEIVAERPARRTVATPPSPAPARPAAATAAPRELLAFRLGGEEYGVDILRVQEIRSYATPTRIANAPAAVRGVLDLRGTIVPVIDLRTRLGLPAPCDGATVTIVLGLGRHVIGAVVDSVCDVLTLQAEQIKPPPAFDAAAQTGHVTGIGTVQTPETRRMLILVDIERLLRDLLPATAR